MRLILIAPENVYEHEVDPSMEVQDVRALVEAEVSELRGDDPPEHQQVIQAACAGVAAYLPCRDHPLPISTQSWPLAADRSDWPPFLPSYHPHR